MAILSEKQKTFCREYIVDLNATKAAIRAGYAERSAAMQACRLLTIDKISAYIQQCKAARAEKTEITADYVLTSLKEVAERCMAPVPVMEWDVDKKERTQKMDDRGNPVFEFDSAGANRALEMLGKHVGIFERDNKQKAAVIKVGYGNEDGES